MKTKFFNVFKKKKIFFNVFLAKLKPFLFICKDLFLVLAALVFRLMFLPEHCSKPQTMNSSKECIGRRSVSRNGKKHGVHSSLVSVAVTLSFLFSDYFLYWLPAAILTIEAREKVPISPHFTSLVSPRFSSNMGDKPIPP